MKQTKEMLERALSEPTKTTTESDGSVDGIMGEDCREQMLNFGVCVVDLQLLSIAYMYGRLSIYH